MSKHALVALLPLILVTAACEDETGPDNERFISTLAGAAEVPQVSTSATGGAEFEVQDDGSVHYTITVRNITGVTAAHIHGPADATQNASVLVSLFPTSASQQTPTGQVTGQLATGTFRAVERQGVSMDSLMRLMRAGSAYVNVHTSTNRGGEIRGQIAPRR